MLKEIYFVNGNGQMEMNFDALALVTSEEFSRFIESAMQDHSEIVSVDVQKYDVKVTITNFNRKVIAIYHYEKNRDKYSYVVYNRYDLEELLGFLEVDKS